MFRVPNRNTLVIRQVRKFLYLGLCQIIDRNPQVAFGSGPVWPMVTNRRWAVRPRSLKIEARPKKLVFELSGP
jgi:hypothetical protein